MKFNFKKITSVLASMAIIGSTTGLAAAVAYPQPFVEDGTGDVAVVYGSNEDFTAATNIGVNLASFIISKEVNAPTGESIIFEKSSTKLQMGYGLKTIISGYIDEDSPSDGLPTLLAEGKYFDNNNDEYEYNQKLSIADLKLEMWKDSEYNDDEPTIGFRVNDGDSVLNYTLNFMDAPAWNEMDTTSINILGKDYFVLNVNNGTTINLLDAAQSTTLKQGESTTLNVNGVAYDITLDFVGKDVSRFTVNGDTTKPLSKGDTQKIVGAYIGIKSIDYQDYAEGVKRVEFSLGNGKIQLEHEQEMEVNGENIDGMKVYFTNSASGSDTTLSKLVIEWKAEDNLFITEEQELIMPGFESVKLTFTEMVYPKEESIKISTYSDDIFMLNDFPMETSVEDIYLLHSANETSFDNNSSGKKDNKQIAVSKTDELVFDADNHEYFIASYNDNSNSESYLMRASNFQTQSSTGDTNKTTFQYKEDGDWVDAGTAVGGESDVISPGGNVEFTVGYVDKDNEQVTITAGTNVEFDTLYSEEGLQLSLPSIVNSTETWNLVLVEEDINENVGQGETITIPIEVDSSEVFIKNPVINGSELEEIEDTDVWRGFVYSALGTEILFDKSDNQNSLELIYHGEESYGKFYLSENLEATNSAGQTSGIVPIKDSEASSMKGNLIVVGGSCINTVAAKLIGSDVPLCDADWTTKTGVGAGEYLIATYANPYAADKIAVLIAGYSKKDTTSATSYLTSEEPDVSIIGTRIEGP